MRLAAARFWHDCIYPIALTIYDDPLSNRTAAKLKAWMPPPVLVVAADERQGLVVALSEATDGQPPK